MMTQISTTLYNRRRPIGVVLKELPRLCCRAISVHCNLSVSMTCSTTMKFLPHSLAQIGRPCSKWAWSCRWTITRNSVIRPTSGAPATKRCASTTTYTPPSQKATGMGEASDYNYAPTIEQIHAYYRRKNVTAMYVRQEALPGDIETGNLG